MGISHGSPWWRLQEMGQRVAWSIWGIAALCFAAPFVWWLPCSQVKANYCVGTLSLQHCVQSGCSLGRQARGQSAVSISLRYIPLYDLMPTKVKLTLRVGKGRAEGYLWHMKESCIVTLCWAVGHTSDCTGQGHWLVWSWMGAVLKNTINNDVWY